MLLLLIIIVCFTLLFFSYRNDGPNNIIWCVIGIVLLVALLRALGLF